MKKYILYTCDNWHTRSSMDIVAVCSSLKTAIKIAKKQASKDGYIINEDDVYMLETKLQTQGYEGDGEFIIEEFEQNKLY